MPRYNLEEKSVQQGFHDSRAKLQIFGGGYGNGKTTALVIKSLRLCIDYPGSNGLLGRSTYPKLNDTLRKVFFLWCPQHWIKRMPTKDDNTCILVNGTTINFRYIAQRGKTDEAGNTTSNLLSATYDWIGIDQVEDPEIEHKDITDLFGRLRGDTPYRPDQGKDDSSMPDTGPRWIMLTLNPTRNWAFKELVQPYIIYRDRGIFTDKLWVDPDTRMPIIELYEGPTHINKRNLAADYLRGLEASHKGQNYKRFILGEWAAYEGLVYEQFDPLRHMISREQAIQHLQACAERDVKVQGIEAYDFGLTSPSCYGCGFIDDFSRVYLVDGFYKAKFDYTKHCEAIQDIREKYRGLIEFEEPILADPDIFKRKLISGRPDGETINNLITENNTNGLRFKPGQSDINAGIAKVGTYLSGHPRVTHPFTGESPGPLFYVCSDLTWFEDEISSYYWRRNPQGNRIDEPIDDNDHAMDMTKYLLSKRPQASQIVIPADKMPPQWTKWHEVADDFRSRAM